MVDVRRIAVLLLAGSALAAQPLTLHPGATGWTGAALAKPGGNGGGNGHGGGNGNGGNGGGRSGDHGHGAGSGAGQGGSSAADSDGGGSTTGSSVASSVSRPFSSASTLFSNPRAQRLHKAHAPHPGGGHGPRTVSAKPNSLGSSPLPAETDDDATTATTTSSNAAGAKPSLGRLNAAHASATALQHASANSAVGKIAAYKAALATALGAITGTDPGPGTAEGATEPGTDKAPPKPPADPSASLDAVAQALAAAANKPVTAETVGALNALLGYQTDATMNASIADKTNAIRTDTTATVSPAPTDGTGSVTGGTEGGGSTADISGSSASLVKR